MASYNISYWLLPAGNSREMWRTTIRDLAGQLGQAPLFEPHATIYVAKDSPEQFSLENIKKAAAGIHKIELKAVALEFTERYTKSCYISFEDSALLAKISQGLEKSSVLKAPYELLPHMSLMYRHLSAHERERVQEQISLPTEPVVFDEIQAWATTANPQTKSDVEAWKLIASHRLG
jgi:hypothetical protein